MEVDTYVNKYCGFPALTQEQLDQANDLFKAYLFFRRDTKTGEHHVWTSCCHQEDYIIERQRTIPGDVAELAYVQHNEHGVCPFCGKEVQFKNLARAGKRRNLKEWQNIVFLSTEDGGVLYAQAYDAVKLYVDSPELSGYPTYRFAAAYEFLPGAPKIIRRDYYRDKFVDATGNRTEEPFLKADLNSYTHEGYCVISLDAIGRSCMKYSQYETYAKSEMESGRHWEMMRYLSTYCLEPKIEMWVKLGLKKVARDLVQREVKNAAAIDWGQQDPKKALGLTKPDFKFFLDLRNPDLDNVVCYKRLKRHGQTVDFQWICEVGLTGCDKIWLVRWALGHKQKFRRVVNYLTKFTGPRCHGGWFGLIQVLQFWKDYLTMAQQLHYDLSEEVVLFPKNLFEAHNTADEILHAEQRREEEEKKKRTEDEYQERIKKLDERYSFQMAGYHIRPPMTIQEIVDEGQALKHCVGGYAMRHAKGIVAILFLRDDNAPFKPLVTIEMNGIHLQQIHGYRNELDGAEDPRKVYAAIVEPWLKWVEAGSKRNKDGAPVLPKTKEVKTA